jgi:NADH-quinone oxidoreductase subunit G
VLWENGLSSASTVIAHESVLTETVRKHADIVFPAEVYAEKEGTLVHPDGRIQRLRPAIGRPAAAPGQPGSGVRAGWQVITDLARRTGSTLNVMAGSMASQALFAAVPFYEGLTLDEIGGRGLRWPARDVARTAFGATVWQPVPLDVPPAPVAPPEGALRLGTFRSIWSSKEVDASPILQYARPSQVSSSLPPTRRASASPTATRWRSAPTARGSAARPGCVTRSRPAASSWPRACPTSRRACSPSPWWRSTAPERPPPPRT